MSINLSHANGASNWMHDKKADTYYGISENYPRECPTYSSYGGFESQGETKPLVLGSHWNRLSGFPKGAYCAGLSIVARIIGVVEPIVKGLGNIFGAPFLKKCDAMTGFKQLAIELPLNILKLVFVMPLEVVADLIVSPFAVMLDTDYSRARVSFEAEMIVKVEDDSDDEFIPRHKFDSLQDLSTPSDTEERVGQQDQ